MPAVQSEAGAPRPVRAKYIPAMLLGAALILGMALRFAFLETPRRTWDEVAYVQYGAALARGEGLPDLIRDYNANPQMTKFPSPTRAGYLWLVLAAMKLGGPRLESVVGLSIAASLTTLLLLAWIVARRFGVPPA